MITTVEFKFVQAYFAEQFAKNLIAAGWESEIVFAPQVVITTDCPQPKLHWYMPIMTRPTQPTFA